MAVTIWLLAVLVLAVVGALTALTAPESVRAALGFSFPTRSRAVDMLVVVVHNLSATGAVIVAAVRPTRAADRLIIGAAALNLGLAGAALGAYGPRLVAHAGLYAAVELGAYSLAFATYVASRKAAHPPSWQAVVVVAALIVLAAALETVTPVRL